MIKRDSSIMLSRAVNVREFLTQEHVQCGCIVQYTSQLLLDLSKFLLEIVMYCCMYFSQFAKQNQDQV